MFAGFPENMNEDIGRYILRTVEVLAAASLGCIVFGVLAYRSTGRRGVVWTWLAVAAGLLALVPPGVVVYAVNH